MQHTHVPSTDHPWVYPKNRRLSKDELQKVHTLMENCTSLDNVREYVSLSYGISLTRSDIWNLRRVKKTVQPLPNSSQSSEHSTNRKVEPVGIKQIEHLFTESPMAIIPNTSDFSSTAPSETPSITHQVNARYKATPIKRTPQSQTEYLARRNSLIGSPAPSKPTDCLQQFRIPIRISNTIAKHATTVPLFPPTASRGPAIALPSISNATSSDPMFKPLNKRVILKVIPRSVLTSNPSANSPGSLRNTNPMLFNALRNCGPGSAKPDVG